MGLLTDKGRKDGGGEGGGAKRICLIKMVTIFMISAKMATPGLLKIKAFRIKGYDVRIFVYDVINKNLSRDSNFILDLVM